MPTTTILHFASPFAFSMPVPKKRTGRPQDADTADDGDGTSCETDDGVSDMEAAAGVDAVSPADEPDGAAPSLHRTAPTAVHPSACHAEVLRRYAEQGASEPGGPSDRTARPDGTVPARAAAPTGEPST